MKNVFPVIILASLLILTVSCSPDSGPDGNITIKPVAEYIKISAEEAKKMIENENVTILDVRTREEFDEIRIAGAILIPDYVIRELAEALLPNKEATILVYCRTGRRSELASRALIEMGYQNVYDFGGIVDWKYKTISSFNLNQYRCFSF